MRRSCPAPARIPRARMPRPAGSEDIGLLRSVSLPNLLHLGVPAMRRKAAPSSSGRMAVA